MSLQTYAEPGTLLKEYRPKSTEPDKPKTHADVWDYADESGGETASQDTRDWIPLDDFPTEDARRPGPPIPDKVIAGDPEYAKWKEAQRATIVGRSGTGKKEKAVAQSGGKSQGRTPSKA